jgi:hypothetical protein
MAFASSCRPILTRHARDPALRTLAMTRLPLAAALASDPRARRDLTLILRDSGCDVIEGADAPAILERLTPGHPPLIAIVADFALDGPLDGVAAALLVIARLGRPVPVLILVDGEDRAGRDAAEGSGFAVLPRPFTAEMLRFHLAGLLLPPCAP